MIKIILLLPAVLLTFAFAEFDMKAFKVGGGNCVLVKTKDKESSKSLNMVVDCGAKRQDYTRALQVKESVVDGVRTIDASRNTPKKSVKKSDLTPSEGTVDLVAITENIRNFFKASVDKLANKLVVKTLFVTHPDEDHIDWVNMVFPPNTVKIDNIVLGGDPKKYMAMKLKKAAGESRNPEVIDWLSGHSDKGTKIYFTALGGDDSTKWFDLEKFKVVDDLNSKFDALQDGKFKLAPSVFSSEKGKSLKKTYASEEILQVFATEVLYFGKDNKVSLLSVNPRNEEIKTHFEDEEKEAQTKKVLPYNFYNDSHNGNIDSLVIKIEDTNSNLSAILMGDANVATTQKIIRNYNPEFLKTNVLLAAHHGSDSYGSNNLEWINLTQPQYVLISAGLNYGHPTKSFYDTMKNSPRLERAINKHKVVLGIGSKNPNVLEALTYKGIFSTMTNGDLELHFKNTLEEPKLFCNTHESEGGVQRIEIKKQTRKQTNEADDELDSPTKLKEKIVYSHNYLLQWLKKTTKGSSVDLDLSSIGTDFIVEYADSKLKQDGAYINAVLRCVDEKSGSLEITGPKPDSEKVGGFSIDFADPRNIPLMGQFVTWLFKHNSFMDYAIEHMTEGKRIIIHIKGALRSLISTALGVSNVNTAEVGLQLLARSEEVVLTIKANDEKANKVVLQRNYPIAKYQYLLEKIMKILRANDKKAAIEKARSEKKKKASIEKTRSVEDLQKLTQGFLKYLYEKLGKSIVSIAETITIPEIDLLLTKRSFISTIKNNPGRYSKELLRRRLPAMWNSLIESYPRSYEKWAGKKSKK